MLLELGALKPALIGLQTDSTDNSEEPKISGMRQSCACVVKIANIIVLTWRSFWHLYLCEANFIYHHLCVNRPGFNVSQRGQHACDVAARRKSGEAGEHCDGGDSIGDVARLAYLLEKFRGVRHCDEHQVGFTERDYGWRNQLACAGKICS